MFGANNTADLTLQSDFVQIPDGDSLTCILPPDGGDYWPYGGSPSSSNNNTTSDGGSGNGSNPSGSNGGGLTAGAKAGIAVGVILGVALLAIATYFIRRAALKKQLEGRGAKRLASVDEDVWEGKQTTYPPS